MNEEAFHIQYPLIKKNWNEYDLDQYDALLEYLKWLIGKYGWTIGLGGR